MSFSDPDASYGREIDPLLMPHHQRKDKFYSLTSRPADTEAGLSDYCNHCLLHYHKYHNMVNNVCQVCGRVAAPIRKDKQDGLAVTSINSSATPPSVRGVSLDVDYAPITNDPTRSLSTAREGKVMKANSIGEAVRMLRHAETSTSRIARAALTGQKYLIKTTGKPDDRKVQFDNNI